MIKSEYFSLSNRLRDGLDCMWMRWVYTCVLTASASGSYVFYMLSAPSMVLVLTIGVSGDELVGTEREMQ